MNKFYRNITTKLSNSFYVINYEVKSINGWVKKEEAFRNAQYGKNYADSLRVR